MSADDAWEIDVEDDGESLAWLAPLRDPFGILKRQRWWALISLLLMLAMSGAAVRLVPLPYQARATMRLSAKSIPDEYVPTTIIANILEQFEAIRGEVFSRAGLIAIIEETGLYQEEREEKVPWSELSSRLAEEIEVKPTTRVGRSVPNSVSFEVIMQGDDASLVAEVVNATVSNLIDANIEFRSRQARVTTDFMKREFERADAELRRHQRDLANFRALHRGSLPEEQESTIAKLERLEEQRRSLILQLSESRDRLSQLEATPSAPGTRASIEALRIQLETAKTLYTDEHPTVRSLERRLMILSETEGPASPADPLFEERTSLRAEIDRQEDRLSQIDADADQIEARLAATPRISEEYAALVRREQILQENYVEYLRKLKDAELSLSLESAQQGAQLVRLDTALTPTDPIIPRWLLTIGAAAVSVMLSIGIAILRELIFPVVIDQAHLETLTQVPCLGSVPEIR